MHLTKGILLIKFPINFDYIFRFITVFVLTILVLVILIIVILLCSSHRRNKKKFLNVLENNSNNGSIFVIEKCDSNEIKIVHTVSKDNHNEIIQNCKTSSDKRKKRRCMCCIKGNMNSFILSDEEDFALIDKEGEVMEIEIREKDLDDKNIPYLSAVQLDGKNEYENGRLSHIDRELPPLPLINVVLESNTGNCESIVKDSLITSFTGSLKYSDLDKHPKNNSLCSNTSEDESTLSRQQSVLIQQSPIVTKIFDNPNISCQACCSTSNVYIPSNDDLSSNDYDPTYAAIRQVKIKCTMCGAPSVYTPDDSNRNSNLSLQLNNCLGSATCGINFSSQNYESLNNSTYASIAKLPKKDAEKPIKRNQEVKSGCSTIKRQRSISQGDIVIGSMSKNNKIQESETTFDSSQISDEKDERMETFFVNKPAFNFMSLWSLMISNRNIPYHTFPMIPDRTYGQSVVDLVERLRKSEKPNFISSSTGTHLGKGCIQPILLGNYFKRHGSLSNSKGQMWTPRSCQVIDGPSFSKSALYSPLKIFGKNSSFSTCDHDFSDHIKGSKKRSCLPFQMMLTPPISPIECKDLILNISGQDELKYENPSFDVSKNDDDITTNKIGSVYEDLDNEGSIIDKNIEVISEKDNDQYECLQDYFQLCSPNYDAEKLLAYTNNNELLYPRARPLSFVLYGDDISRKDKCFDYNFDNLEVCGASSVQMSPLMEQSFEISSSKTTLSSYSYHQQLNRFVSSEDSCAKSPPSADTSASLDKLEIASPDDHNFFYNDFLLSNFNSAFDDYEIFE